METLSQGITNSLREHGDAPALFWKGEQFTFAELDAWSGDLAAGLARMGVRAGDRVAVGLPNSPQMIAAMIGVLRSGAVLVPLHPAATADELAYILTDAESELVVTHDEQARRIKATGHRADVVDDLGSLRSAPRPLPDGAPEDPALIVYTSGTTGHPKGAVLSNRALVANLTSVARTWRWTSHDRVLLTLPCFHLHGLGLGVFTSLLVGSSIVLRPRFVVEEIPELLAARGCTMFLGVPTMYNRLVLLPEELVQVARRARLRLWISGSAPLTPATFERFRRRFGFPLMNRYGMTETCFVLCTPCDQPRRGGVVGTPFPGIDVRLIDPDQAADGVPIDVPDGETGELILRGPNLFSGYWGRPEETRASFLDGFFRSGDLAVREADGQFRIVGRRSVDIIKSGGFKIGAIEIENRLQEHPAIAEVAVVGMPDRDMGEAVVAAVVRIAGSDLSEGDVRNYARQHLAPHKIPARVVFVDEIPRTGPGKFKKRALIERLTAR